MHTALDVKSSPFLVIWEVTQACDLACKHCRASAQSKPLPGELTTEEGIELLDDVASMGCKIVVLTGGDPLKRSDLSELIHHGKSIGLRMATIPAATDLLTAERLQELKVAGIDQIAFSLDFPTEELHDQFRGTQGAFRKTMEAIEWAHNLKIPLQINTTITALSLPHLREMGRLVSKLGIVFWEVFFLVPTGRGTDLASLTPDQCEEAFEILYRVHKECKFILKVTEGPHYRRYVSQVEGAERGVLPERMRKSEGPGGTIGRAPQAVNSGKGFAFVSYKGDILPSGFLPVHAGNVRSQKFSETYRTAPVFLELRDSSRLLGICGRCDFAEICGGSRSRAYALTGNYLASDPWCGYRGKPPIVSREQISEWK